MKSIVFVGYDYAPETILPAKKMGYKAILLGPNLEESPFDEILITNLRDPDSILKNCKKIKNKYNVKAVITRMERFTPQQAFIAHFFNIPATPKETATACRNKGAFRKILGNSEFNIASQLVKTEEEAVKVAVKLKYPVIIKNIAGAKSLFIKKVENEKLLRKNFTEIINGIKTQESEYTLNFQKFFPEQKYPSPRTNVLIEKFITGEQITIVTFVSGRKIWNLPILCKVITAKESGITDTYLLSRTIPYEPKANVKEKIFEAATFVAKQLKAKRCGMHTELLVTKDGKVKILETTTRIGGFRQKMFKAAYGIDLYKLLTSFALGKSPNIKLKQKCAVTAVEKFHSSKGVIQSLTGIQEISEKKDVLGFKQQKTIGDKIGPASKGYRAICYFMVTGKTKSLSRKKALQYLKEIRVIVKQKEEKPLQHKA